MGIGVESRAFFARARLVVYQHHSLNLCFSEIIFIILSCVYV